MGISSELKNSVKKAIRLILGTKPVNMPLILEKADTVSFDIFDSLVRRDVPSPGCVHDLVEREFFSQTGRTIPHYSWKRRQAETAAYARAARHEITLSRIFEEMDSVDTEDKARLMALEMEMEYRVCCADPDMKEIFERTKQAGTQVVITSDMYLPEAGIRRILAHCGYGGYGNLYLSSSYGVTKASGQLYRYLLAGEKHSSKPMVHIGDNIKSDYLRAGQAGLKPILIRDRTHPLRFHKAGRQESFDAACFRTFLSNHKPRGTDCRDELAISIGYEVLGPLLLGYSRWLNTQAEHCRIKKIFFLSREGRLLKRAYETLYPHSDEAAVYLYVSRQALQVPLLLFCHDFHELCRQIKPLMREHTLQSIGRICHLGADYEKRLAALDLTPEDDLFHLPEMVQAPYFHLVMELGTDYFAKQYDLVKTYLAQEGMDGPVLLSDIGWHGTMQKALCDYCQDTVHLQGCYMGCWNPSSSKCYEDLARDGYLTTPGGDKEMELLLRFSCDIVETLLSNSEGSVAAYGRMGDRVIPILLDNERNLSSRTFIHQVQEYAMDFLRDINCSRIYSQADIPKELVFAGLRHLLQNPSKETINCFKNCKFLDGTLRSMLPDHSVGWYLFHPGLFVSDFEKSSCKLFFLKDVFKVPLPWFRLLKFLRENLKLKSSNQKIWLEQ